MSSSGQHSVQGDGRLIGRVRKDRIAQIIHDRGFMSSAALAEQFGVSEMTIRRDLAELELRGVIQRTHGGAVTETHAPTGEDRGPEPFFDEREARARPAKLAIARAAAGLAADARSVALDVGTTTYALGQVLASEARLRVFTNNVRVAALGRRAGAEIYAIGGHIRPHEMAMCGPIAVEQASKLWFDIAYLGISAISTDGLFDYSVEEAEMKRVFCERATRRVVVADSSKFGGRSLVQVGGLECIDVLVTEAPPPAELAGALAQAGVEVIVAE